MGLCIALYKTLLDETQSVINPNGFQSDIYISIYVCDSFDDKGSNGGIELSSVEFSQLHFAA